MSEVWKHVVGFEGRYEVSDTGRVRSVDRIEYAVKKWGTKYTRVLKGKILKIIPKSDGYSQVNLGLNNPQLVHSIVLTAFVGPMLPDQECRHLNGIKSKNELTNLKWGTPKENSDDAILHGTKPRGEKTGNSKLKEHDVIEARSSKESASKVAARLGVVKSTVLRIRSRKTWAHLP